MSKLERFLEAQERDYRHAMQEILAGRKQTHWIWYIFPQLRGNGHSENSIYYGIENLEEARDYLHNPVLELRLLAAMDAMMFHRDRPAAEILGSVDAAKLRSCATLFHLARPEEQMFRTVLKAFFRGAPCPLTVKAVDQFS
ncbi:DUF1810 domain-containing protein [Mangrovicoccus algicola]|uniref:DUF1810 domain-containing protein n=1 Tax=Mangrovicoccus algicola TaxID=2771008 RepID=A0A8J7CHD3_9RHOB|nr:DUF1810 domain-containing protein [Mangrovicoccus algicola]MBE3638070.1 DUF1810 domain-containing protein [Mangrovicoccus algicola]